MEMTRQKCETKVETEVLNDGLQRIAKCSR